MMNTKINKTVFTFQKVHNLSGMAKKLCREKKKVERGIRREGLKGISSCQIEEDKAYRQGQKLKPQKIQVCGMLAEI